MSTAMYPIVAGDYNRAGAASSGLKEMLKKVGVDPAALRRAMIAAYEAEMNVVIHSVGGHMRVTLEDGTVDVEVADEGPGIPDIELAMKDGYSTAPAAARELGFGAGMGLPNIKRNSDRFDIESAVGQGTRVRFAVHFAAQAASGRWRTSVRVVAERCRGCLRCLHACPTAALRVRGGRPQVLEHLCFDCGACIAACETGALASKGREEEPRSRAGLVLIVPPALLVQGGPGADPRRALRALADLGFGEVWVTDGWEEALRGAVARYAREEARVRPVLSPACAAVVSLVEMRFPSLIGHLAPFASPVEAARREVAGRDAVVVAGCPADHSALFSKRGQGAAEIAAPQGLVQAILRRLAEGGGSPPASEAAERAGSAAPEAARVLRVTGVRHVVAALEAAENGQLGDADVLELYACDAGCFGSPLLREEPFVARWRWESAGVTTGQQGRALRREEPFAARQGLRLDQDMAKAIEKLSRLDRLVRSLPGKDCGLCGAPTCAALAEDIVLGRAETATCPFQGAAEEKTS